jgi:protein associated with RNAse G/E
MTTPPRAIVVRHVAWGHVWYAMPAWLLKETANHWYVNLQAPLHRTPLGFDTNDHTLDVLVAPDKTWRWKDEDQLADAVGVGIYTADVAAEIRAEAERVIANFETRLPTGWETWQPDLDWPLLSLPAGWEENVD